MIQDIFWYYWYIEIFLLIETLRIMKQFGDIKRIRWIIKVWKDLWSSKSNYVC